MKQIICVSSCSTATLRGSFHFSFVAMSLQYPDPYFPPVILFCLFVCLFVIVCVNRGKLGIIIIGLIEFLNI